MSSLDDIVTIYNRTQRTLTGTWGGRQKDLPPGETKVTRIEALKYREQHPVMGIGSPLEDWGQKGEYLLAIIESGDDTSPIEQSNAPQRWDPSINTLPVVPIKGRGGMYSGGDSRLPADNTGFTTPSESFSKP